MIKKEVLFIALTFIIICSFVVSASDDVAYIYRKNFNIDNNVVRIFNSSGLDVHFINEKDLPVNFAQYRFLYVGDENFLKENLIPINNYPTIVSSYYHAEDWGLTDAEGVSQLASDHALSVKQNGRMIQVYTQATKQGINGPSLSYYFLDIENRAPSLQTIATTETTSSGEKFGDVISYANPGALLEGGKIQHAKLCFFGIQESDFWTPAAKSLFNDCLGFVAAECTTDADCPAPSYSEPFCQNGDVYKTKTSNVCRDGLLAECVANETSELVEDCSYDCFNGACIGECETNSDCGTDHSVSGLFCTDKNITELFQIFTCNGAGTSNAFCSSVIINKTVEACEDLCVDGSCVDVACFTDSDCNDDNASTEDVCHNAGQAASYCTNEKITCFANSDCGLDGFIDGKSCSNLDVTQVYKTFTCTNPGKATSACSSQQETKVIQTCSDVCVLGECKDIACYSDSECSDSNPLTFDQCINNGTIISECRHTTINCASNSDCGFTGFLGSEFCSDDSIFKNYQTALCLNPGKTNSHCDISVEKQQVSECEFACANGACVRCDSNFDCNDNNPNTNDVCQNPNTPESFCKNSSTAVTCSVNSDCGSTTVLSPLFCSDKDINHLIQTWTCNNPTQTTSYCSSNFQTETTQTCADFCTNGACISIRCFTDSDCNDDNASTEDICNNPGNSDSYCTNNPTTIVCASDSDCGTDGFTGEPFCLANEVNRLFLDFTCHNPNTKNSYCSTTSSQLVLQECEFGCSKGMCVPQQGECIPGEIRTCSTNVGECTKGINVCFTDAVWSEQCFGGILPSQEICDDLDNDCDGQTDEGDVCGGGCTNQCADSERKCSNNGFQICHDYNDDGCTEWSDVTQCSTGQTCENGFCQTTPPACTDECTLNSRECFNNGFKICGNYDSDSCLEWSEITQCSANQICQNGVCIPAPPSCTDECTNGDRKCSDNGFQICRDYDGNGCTEWSGTTGCSYNQACVAGFCV
jgi:hypothetical protein